MRLSTLVIFLVLICSIALILHRFPYITLTADEKGNVFFALVIAAALFSGVIVHYRGKMGEMFRHIGYWLCVVIVIIAGYSYRDSLLNNRIISSLVPQRAIVNNDGTITFRAASNGHFYVESRINNVLVKFMVDTGASDITLSASDATRIGLQPDKLNYSRSYHTANGTIHGAPVMLEDFSVGPITIPRISASVNKADMGTSLLGMEFFRQLRGFSVEGDVLTLHP